MTVLLVSIYPGLSKVFVVSQYYYSCVMSCHSCHSFSRTGDSHESMHELRNLLVYTYRSTLLFGPVLEILKGTEECTSRVGRLVSSHSSHMETKHCHQDGCVTF